MTTATDTARGAARDAFHAALTAPGYLCDSEARDGALEAALDAHLAALDAAGLLHHHQPEQEDTEVGLTVEECARWLGGMTGHPRYADGRWRRLLVDSLEHAVACAQRRYAGQQDVLADLVKVRDALDAHQKGTRP